MNDGSYLCWQGNRQQPLWEVIADARGLFADRYGVAPREVLVPLTAGETLGRPVEWLFYRADRWHVAVGPVPALGWDAKPRTEKHYTQLEATL
jgi:hypothetical protein